MDRLFTVSDPSDMSDQKPQYTPLTDVFSVHFLLLMDTDEGFDQGMVHMYM